MPYIKKEDRGRINDSLGCTIDTLQILTAGELNYAFTLLAKQYIANRGGPTYQVLNDVVGALDGAKVEFQRRVVAPYEDSKIEENGDVY